MIFVMPDSGVDVNGVDTADAVRIPCVVPSLQSATDNGVRYLTLAQLALALNRSTTYTADGAISLTPGTHILSKSSAGAFTLAAPTAAQEGMELVLIAGTAFAHVITATNLLDDGVTGGAKDTATMAAFVGASLVLRATSLRWVAVGKTQATIAAV
jgi:hypothetical protein